MSFLKSLLGGQVSTVSLQPSGVTFQAKSNKSILEAALAQGVAFPHSCTVGTCGACKCRLRSGKIRELTDFAYILSGEELRGGIVLACQAAARTDVVLEIDGVEDHHLNPSIDVDGQIVSADRLAHDVISLVVELASPMAFDGGQYATFSFPGVFGKRSYSFACPPQAGGCTRIEFWVRHVPGGAFTDILFSGNVIGEKIRVHGPLGNFWLRGGDGPILGIAGGSGLAPLVSMLEQAINDGVQRDCALLFGAREARDLYAMDQIASIGARWKGSFKFEPILSDVKPGSDWTGKRGLVTEFIDGAFGADFPPATQAYLCGPPGMIDAAIPVLKGLSIAPKDIHFDKFLDARDNIRRQT